MREQLEDSNDSVKREREAQKLDRGRGFAMQEIVPKRKAAAATAVTTNRELMRRRASREPDQACRVPALCFVQGKRRSTEGRGYTHVTCAACPSREVLKLKLMLVLMLEADRGLRHGLERHGARGGRWSAVEKEGRKLHKRTSGHTGGRADRQKGAKREAIPRERERQSR